MSNYYIKGILWPNNFNSTIFMYNFEFYTESK